MDKPEKQGLEQPGTEASAAKAGQSAPSCGWWWSLSREHSNHTALHRRSLACTPLPPSDPLITIQGAEQYPCLPFQST